MHLHLQVPAVIVWCGARRSFCINFMFKSPNTAYLETPVLLHLRAAGIGELPLGNCFSCTRSGLLKQRLCIPLNSRFTVLCFTNICPIYICKIQCLSCLYHIFLYYMAHYNILFHFKNVTVSLQDLFGKHPLSATSAASLGIFPWKLAGISPHTSVLCSDHWCRTHLYHWNFFPFTRPSSCYKVSPTSSCLIIAKCGGTVTATGRSNWIRFWCYGRCKVDQYVLSQCILIVFSAVCTLLLPAFLWSKKFHHFKHRHAIAFTSASTEIGTLWFRMIAADNTIQRNFYHIFLIWLISTVKC